MNSVLGDNPLRTRTDLQQALHQLWTPLRGRFSPGCARVRLGATGAHFSTREAELEGFSRPLWGLAALAAGGAEFAHWELYRQGLVHGTDPSHPEYWGRPGDHGHQLVEMPSISLALGLAREHLWDPLPSREREQIVAWLRRINEVQVFDNNWLFFRVLVNLGLAAVGAEPDRPALDRALDRLDAFYLGDGWYSDGGGAARDYYVAFAFHYYGLIYARLAGPSERERAQCFTERARLFARDFVYWFDAEGAALPFGRSLTYRFAQAAFWSALPFADVAALPWGVVKGLALRHLRWWVRRPILDASGVLSLGYAYPNLNVAEAYNAPASPYWAFKYFLLLAVPEDHAFWQADEAPLPELSPSEAQKHPALIIGGNEGRRHVFALSAGQEHPPIRHGGAKYAKFAYSTAFAFSVPSGGGGPSEGAYDSALALSEEGRYFRVRERSIETRLADGVLYARWQPWNDVDVRTWLLAFPPWHVRIHRLESRRPLVSAEGGFALDRSEADGGRGQLRSERGLCLTAGEAGWSGIRDLRRDRVGRPQLADPNTNLLHPRTVIPTLFAEHPPSTRLLACAVLGLPPGDDGRAAWNAPPALEPVGDDARELVLSYAGASKTLSLDGW